MGWLALADRPPISAILAIAVGKGLCAIVGLCSTEEIRIMVLGDKSWATTTAQPLYEADFYGWTQQQVHLLQQQRWAELDIANLVEEIESLGRQQRQELRNRLGVLLGHLLKWQFQPDRRSKSWVATLREQRREILILLEESPSLKPYLPEAIAAGYQAGLDLLVRETPLDYSDLPTICNYTTEQILSSDFWPGPS